MLKPIAIPVAFLKALRPKQATKNLFVYAALIFAGRLSRLEDVGRVTLAFLLFTAITGSVYLLNDLLDIEKDRLHPTKKNRPLASGELPVWMAYIGMGLLGSGGIAASYFMGTKFGIALTTYLVLQIAYCFWLKHIVLLDVFTIAIGFVLRVVAGAFSIHVQISSWILLCSLQLALFLGFGKRRQELVLLGEEADKHRTILSEYSLPFLDQLIQMVSAVTIVCYSVYTIESQSAYIHPHLWITVPIVIFSICRYLYLVYRKGWGGAPDEVLLKDRTLQAAIVLWLLTILWLFAYDRVGRPLFGIS